MSPCILSIIISYPSWLKTLPIFIWIPWPCCSACLVPFRFFQFICVQHWITEETELVLRHITKDGSSVSGCSRNCPSSCRSRSSLSNQAQPPMEHPCDAHGADRLWISAIWIDLADLMTSHFQLTTVAGDASSGWSAKPCQVQFQSVDIILALYCYKRTTDFRDLNLCVTRSALSTSRLLFASSRTAPSWKARGLSSRT